MGAPERKSGTTRTRTASVRDAGLMRSQDRRGTFMTYGRASSSSISCAERLQWLGSVETVDLLIEVGKPHSESPLDGRSSGRDPANVHSHGSRPSQPPTSIASGGEGSAAVDTRIVRADAVHVDRASLPYTNPVGVNADACLKEAFSGNERYEFPARAESVPLRSTQLESEPGKCAARPVRLPRVTRVGKERAMGRGASGTRVVHVIVVVMVIRPAERGHVGREGRQGKHHGDRWLWRSAKNDAPNGALIIRGVEATLRAGCCRNSASELEVDRRGWGLRRDKLRLRRRRVRGDRAALNASKSSESLGCHEADFAPPGDPGGADLKSRDDHASRTGFGPQECDHAQGEQADHDPLGHDVLLPSRARSDFLVHISTPFLRRPVPCRCRPGRFPEFVSHLRDYPLVTSPRLLSGGCLN